MKREREGKKYLFSASATVNCYRMQTKLYIKYNFIIQGGGGKNKGIFLYSMELINKINKVGLFLIYIFIIKICT